MKNVAAPTHNEIIRVRTFGGNRVQTTFPMNEQQEQVIKGKPYFCVSLVVTLASSMWALDKWFFPWLSDFSSKAHCEEFFGFNGLSVLFGAIFIGATLFFFVFTCWLFWIENKQAKTGQIPAPGTFVCRDTVVKPYTISKTRKYLLYLTPLLGVGMVIFGVKLFMDIKVDIIDPGLQKSKYNCISTNNMTPSLTLRAVRINR